MNQIYDAHIHLMPGECNSPEVFAIKAAKAGITGGLIFSLPPMESAMYRSTLPPNNRFRMENVLSYCRQSGGRYYPAFWFNPTEPDAAEQVIQARELGIRALKVICSKYPPCAGLMAYRQAAELGMPIIFHSGILWDGEVSTDFNRPSAFECLLEVYGLRFALAHAAWPWCDELLALYGKLRQAEYTRKDRKLEMFVDISPGVPDIYREDVFRKFMLLNYNPATALIWGVDSSANNYDAGWAEYIYEFDRKTFAVLQEQYGKFRGYSATGSFMKSAEYDFNEAFRCACSENILRFIG